MHTDIHMYTNSESQGSPLTAGWKRAWHSSFTEIWSKGITKAGGSPNAVRGDSPSFPSPLLCLSNTLNQRCPSRCTQLRVCICVCGCVCVCVCVCVCLDLPLHSSVNSLHNKLCLVPSGMCKCLCWIFLRKRTSNMTKHISLRICAMKFGVGVKAGYMCFLEKTKSHLEYGVL